MLRGGPLLSILPAWIATATPTQRRTLLAASLGWMLDSMDVMLYAMVIPYVAREMHLSDGAAGGLMSATLLAAAAGGLLFGVVADRAGRTRAMTASMLLYSLATAACGFTHTPVQLLLARVVLGFGMGGEWAAGAALVAETWPDALRGRALAVVQSFWAVGYALGAGLTALLLPRFGWRGVFFAGIVPALVTLWMRRSLQEPEAWLATRGKTAVGESSRGFRALFRAPLLHGTVVSATMNATTLFAWWGLFTWVPRFLALPVAKGGHGLSVVGTSTWVIVMQAGTFAGYVSFGFLAERWTAKRVYIAYLTVATLTVPVFAAVHSAALLLLVGPVVGFFGTGYFSGFSAITSELFPTSLRASAMGFVYNIGRVASAVAPFAIGRLADRKGMPAALSVTALAFAVAAVIATRLRGTVRQGGLARASRSGVS